MALATLAERVPGTTAVWVLRRGAVGSVFGGGDADQLPARGALGVRAREAVAAGHIEVVTGFRTEALERRSEQLPMVPATRRCRRRGDLRADAHPGQREKAGASRGSTRSSG